MPGNKPGTNHNKPQQGAKMIKALLEPAPTVCPPAPPTTRRLVYISHNGENRALYIDYPSDLTLEAVLDLFEIQEGARKFFAMKHFLFWTLGLPDWVEFSEINLGSGFILLSDPANHRNYTAMTAGQIVELLNELEELRSKR